MRPLLVLLLSVAIVGGPLRAQFMDTLAAPERGGTIGSAIDELDSRIQHDFLYGIISRHDWQQLRAESERLRQVQREHRSSGRDSSEDGDLVRRLSLLRDRVRAAEERGRFAAGSIVQYPEPRQEAARVEAAAAVKAEVGETAGGELLEPGGAYPEDLRVGDEAPVNLGLLPDHLRSRYRDGNGVYYRYWGGTVYEVDEDSDRIRSIRNTRN